MSVQASVTLVVAVRVAVTVIVSLSVGFVKGMEGTIRKNRKCSRGVAYSHKSDPCIE
jgi:hypothetical protein